MIKGHAHSKKPVRIAGEIVQRAVGNFAMPGYYYHPTKGFRKARDIPDLKILKLEGVKPVEKQEYSEGAQQYKITAAEAKRERRRQRNIKLKH